MKSKKKILVAFLINLFFSVFEFVGGIITGSIAVMSDAIHDFGDAFSIGVSLVLEKISERKPDEKYTYGYIRYSVLGGVIQSAILLCGSLIVIYKATERMFFPGTVEYGKMIIIALVGFFVNFFAAYFTRGEDSINQKAINLHMLEDVLGWGVVLLGAVVMKFTDFYILDSILSIALAVFIMYGAIKNLKSVLDIFLEKTPEGINVAEIKEHLLNIEGVFDVHHLHIWSMDGFKNSATLHAVITGELGYTKKRIKEELKEHGISHITVECEVPGENCGDEICESGEFCHSHHHHGHHHHGHHH